MLTPQQLQHTAHVSHRIASHRIGHLLSSQPASDHLQGLHTIRVIISWYGCAARPGGVQQRLQHRPRRKGADACLCGVRAYRVAMLIDLVMLMRACSAV